MAIMLNPRPKVYENIFFSASQPPDSSTILQPAGIAAGRLLVGSFEPEGKPLPMEKLPANPQFVELHEDWDHFMLPMSKAMEMIPALEEEVIRMDGRIVGYLGSGAYGFTLGASVGMGYVRDPDGVTRELIESASWEIEIACERYPAEASLRAFHDPAGTRVRS